MIDPSKLDEYKKEEAERKADRPTDYTPKAKDGVYKWCLKDVKVSRQTTKKGDRKYIMVRAKATVVEPSIAAGQERAFTLPMFLRADVAAFLIASGRAAFDESTLDAVEQAFADAEFVASVNLEMKNETKINKWQYLPSDTKVTGPFAPEALAGEPVTPF